MELGLELRRFIWDVGITNGSLTTVPRTCPFVAAFIEQSQSILGLSSQNFGLLSKATVCDGNDTRKEDTVLIFGYMYASQSDPEVFAVTFEFTQLCDCTSSSWNC